MNETIPKTVPQFSYPIDDIQWKSILSMAGQYRNCKNYIFSRFSGIRSLSLIHDQRRFRKEIRDAWSGESGFGQQWRLSARMRNLALDDAKGNIKTEWSNTKRRIKENVRRNENLSDNEKGYIYYVLKADPLLEAILCRRPFEKTKKMKDFGITEERKLYIHNLICRYVKKKKGKISHTKKYTFKLDPCMYSYHQANDGLYLTFCSQERGKRIRVKVKDDMIHQKTLTVIIHPDEQVIEIHALKKVKTRSVCKETKGKVIGADKGYTDLLSCSSEKVYGKGIHQLMTKETEEQDKKLKKRNKIYSQMKKCKEDGDLEKAERIRKNNFGRKKWNRQRKKAKANLESEINHAIRLMIHEEVPEKVVLEKLTFQSWHKKMAPGVKRKLSRWAKGILDDRLKYICSLYRIEIVYVNAAYTSQTCSECGCLGNRNGKSFECPHCGHKGDADINASKVIRSRENDSEIDLYTPYKIVKTILETRTKEYDKIHHVTR